VKYVHTNIIAADWRALSEFYIKVFNCIVVPPERDQKGGWLSKGTGVANAQLRGIHLRLPGYGNNGPTLEIYQYANMEDKPAAVANRKGFGHIAFEVDNIELIVEKIIEHNGRKIGELTEHEIDGVGTIMFIYMADPEDNILEIQHWNYS
jgi:catechol 2,3-dioxygenase-like lactoylglutathione lyase family enzyme